MTTFFSAKSYNNGTTPESAAWSRDGKRIAFLSGRQHLRGGGGEVSLTVRNVSTGQENEWKMPNTLESVVEWSADSGAIYLYARTGNRAEGLKLELLSASATTGELKSLATISGPEVIRYE